uniref:Uncharacterized protein n=1 Tax=viral metagenome TaxID=1070528 RepID=A0A6C0C7S1_9ZZZZ
MNLNITSRSIFDPKWINVIDTTKKIGIISQDDSVLVNIYHILVNILRKNVIRLQHDNWIYPLGFLPSVCKTYNNFDDLLKKCENIDCKNTTLIVDQHVLSLLTKYSELESQFGNVIYSYRHQVHFDSEIYFIDRCTTRREQFCKICVIYELTNVHKSLDDIANYMGVDELMIIKKKSLEVCNMELLDTYPNYNHKQYSPHAISKIIQIIRNGQSAFHEPGGNFNKLLQSKQNFLIDCIYVHWSMIHFITKLNLMIFSKDMLAIIFEFMFLLFEEKKQSYLQ